MAKEELLEVKCNDTKNRLKVHTWEVGNPCREVVLKVVDENSNELSISINQKSDILRIVQTLKRALPPFNYHR